MAIVIRQGKRYRYSEPYSDVRFGLLRYDPIQDASGKVSDKELIFIVRDAENQLDMECDGDDACEIARQLDALERNELSPSQFAAILDEMIRQTMRDDGTTS